MTHEKILIIEDDEDIREGIRRAAAAGGGYFTRGS